MSRAQKSAKEVLQTEIRQVKERREALGKQDAISDKDKEPLNPHDFSSTGEEQESGLTGLALSGGGVRAAAFSLGVIQGLYSAGRMKAFDFLSTVSGGGYAGALFSSEVARTDEVNWERREKGQTNRLDIEPDGDGSQSERVARLAMHGRMMTNMLRLFSRHFWGFLVNVTFALSGVVAIAAALAYMMRWPWGREIFPTLRELNFNTDLYIPFFFAFIALLVWVLSHCAAYLARILNRRVPTFTQYTYLLLLGFVVLGFVSLLALGEVDLSALIKTNDLESDVYGKMNTIINWVAIGLGGLLATTLLPYFSPKRLLRSGETEAGPAQRFMFGIAGKALLFGAPLFVFYLLAMENISGHTMNRADSDQLVRTHTKLLDRLIPKLEAEWISDFAGESHIARRLMQAINDKTDPSDTSQLEEKSPEAQDEIKGFLEKLAEMQRTDAEIGFATRWAQWFAHLTGVSNEFEKRVECYEGIREGQRKIAYRINRDCLSDPRLFLSLTNNQEKELGSKNDSSMNGSRSYEDIGAKLNLQFVDETTAKKTKKKLTEAVKELYSSKHQLEKRYLAKDEQGSSSEQVARDGTLRSTLQFIASVVKRSRVAEPPSTRQSVTDAVVKYVDGKVRRANKNDDRQTVEISGKYAYYLQQVLNLEKEDFLETTGLQDSNWTAERKEEIEKERDRQARNVNEWVRAIRENNWVLLNAMYPNYILPQETTFAYVVNAEDQAFRVKIGFIAALIFLAIGLGTNLNSTSLHGVYRDQLAEIWLDDPKMKLQDLETCSRGAPYHLINATVNRMGHRNDPDVEGQSRFVMSQLFCGTKKVGYRESNDYQEGDLRVADSVAISGAAVTSLTAPTLLHQLILFITNVRLGQWMANPQTYLVDHYWPAPIRCYLNTLWNPEQRSCLFVSDGGHLDNTGLACLFERRCQFMLCVDGSHDPKYKFADLMKVFHSARAKYGITINAVCENDEKLPVTQWLDRLKEDECGFSKGHFVVFEIDYPKQENLPKAILIYSKLTVSDNEPIELVEMARTDEHFPHDPTSNQFLAPDVFDAYMTLGNCIAIEIDQFVQSGKLDRYNLPLGWSSDGEQPKCEPVTESLSSTEQAAGVKSKTDTALLEAELEKQVFDRQGIAFAVKTLKSWFADTNENPGVELDSAVVEVVFKWAKEHGLDAPTTPRQEFCKAVTKLVRGNIGIVKSNREISADFGEILSDLGGRSKLAVDLRKYVGPAPDNNA